MTVYLSLAFLKYVFEVKLMTHTTRKTAGYKRKHKHNRFKFCQLWASASLTVWPEAGETYVTFVVSYSHSGISVVYCACFCFFLGLTLHILLRFQPYSHRHPCPPPKHARPGHFWACAQCHADRKWHASLKQWKDLSTVIQGHTRSKVRHTWCLMFNQRCNQNIFKIDYFQFKW